MASQNHLPLAQARIHIQASGSIYAAVKAHNITYMDSPVAGPVGPRRRFMMANLFLLLDGQSRAE